MDMELNPMVTDHIWCFINIPHVAPLFQWDGIFI